MKQPSPSVTTTRLFRNGNSQAVRIPKTLAFDSVDIEVEIERRGDELIVRPAKQKLTGLGAAFRKIGASIPRFPPRPRRGVYDCQTAAHAISLGVVLVTNNEKDFNGIPDVVVENWTLPPLTPHETEGRCDGTASSCANHASSTFCARATGCSMNRSGLAQGALGT